MTTSLFDLTGRVAIVTGGNGGIGLAMAQGLANAGADIAVVGRNQAKSEAVLAELTAAGVRAIALTADVTSPADINSAVARTKSAFGRIDILINNAGMSVRKSPQDLSLEEWDSVIRTNLTSAFIFSQAVYPELKAGGGGKIINIGSMMSILGASFTAAYGASKGGIVQLTRSLAVAWAPDNVQVNAVLPGWIDTELTRTARAQVGGLQDKVEARTPAARWGNPADMSGVAVFLASAASDFVTGTAIAVDGGYSIAG